MTDGLSVAVVGAGLMGSQIAAEYALGGHRIAVCNRSRSSSDAAVARCIETLSSLRNQALITDREASLASGRLRAASDMADACSAVSIVVESVVEDLAAKVEVLGTAAQLAPTALLLTNTSSLSIGDLAEKTQAWERLVGAHYLNPPVLMPLVEVIPGLRTPPDVVRSVLDLLSGMGKIPLVAPDIPGFIWNRLQFALLREAAAMHQREGVSAETIDLVMTHGLGRRWSITGPFEAMLLGGLPTFQAAAERLFPSLTSDSRPEEIGQSNLSALSGISERVQDRDLALAKLLLADRAT